MEDEAPPPTSESMAFAGTTTPVATRAYQQEMLDESLRGNIIIALDTGSGKTHIAVLRIKHEVERGNTKICWFLAPTVALCQQQQAVIRSYIPGPVGLISGAHQPEQWKNATLWRDVLETHKIIVSTPQVFLDALRHGYINMGAQIGLLVFDEAHHAVDNHPYNRIMHEFYFTVPPNVRPMVLGLTASPIFGGGDVNKAFKLIEANMDSNICTPRYHRNELARYVHRPIFKHAPYMSSPTESFSTNLATLSAIIQDLDFENDPYVVSLRKQILRTSPSSSEHRRLDQKLSKVLTKQDSFTHRGLRDFERAARDICHDLGAWAADWFVWTVVDKAKHAANPYNNIMSTWKSQEKRYLLDILNRLVLSPVSRVDDDILEGSSDKARVLVECLVAEKEEVEQLNQPFSAIVFVQRRDEVLALSELLTNHPVTKEAFNIGVLLGTSESGFRHSLMDVTRHITKQSQDTTISEFKIGMKNLIISTSVAEEGIDIPACGSVIRWDPPLNMASWIQSRGRARRERSTFTLMYDVEEDRHQNNVSKWKVLEERMVGMYSDPSRLLPDELVESNSEEPDDFDSILRVESTGASITPHSAVSHLSHFCAIISRSGNAENRPIYDIDPPDYLPGWHSIEPKPSMPLYEGPWSSTVTLPRSLPIPVRQFSTDRSYRSKLAAHRHAAFKAYKALYDLELLNEHLLPFSSNLDPELTAEVQAMLADIEKRAGTARVGLQFDPWEAHNDDEVWYLSEMFFNNATSPLLFYSRRPMSEVSFEAGPELHRPGQASVKLALYTTETVIHPSDPVIAKAQEYTRMLFWCLNGSRMDWDDTAFSYLFFPRDHDDFKTEWAWRREWLEEVRGEEGFRSDLAFVADAEVFIKKFGYVEDLTIIRKNSQFGRPYSFVRWQYERLSEEDEEGVRESYAKRWPDLEVTYPLMVVKPFPPRSNFLVPLPPLAASTPEVAKAPTNDHSKELYFVPHLSGITLFSPEEVEYAFLLPSILHWFSLHLNITSLRGSRFLHTPLFDIPTSLLMMAMTAPVSQERTNYQRLETLGDAVLKFGVSVQTYAEYPVWHEGYLTRKKDHAVSNAKLAKENIQRQMYRWIIRDRLLGKKWKPKYTTSVSPTPPISDHNMVLGPEPPKVTGLRDEAGGGVSTDEKKQRKKKKKKKQSKELSTKVLADVVESLIGAAYLHGGFNLGYECTKFFDLGIKWEPLPSRLNQIISKVHDDPEQQIPPQISDVEQMFGYTFTRKILLIEALTHASYREHSTTISYERLEFIGDSILDMIVTDFLYNAPGKEYSPGHMHLRKSAVVNGHFLSFICLGLRREHDSVMPYISVTGDNEDGTNPYGFQPPTFEAGTSTHQIFLWQCLLHSSQQVLDDQRNTFTRYQKRKDEIQESLDSGTIFPWASLTRLQSPKFLSDMIESVIGAIYIDSHGDMSTIKNVLHVIGILPVLERIVNHDVDILHPVSRLSMWASRNDKKIEYKFEKERGDVSCAILVDGREEIREKEKYRGNASQEEVKFVAAEKAIKLFKLRDANSGFAKRKVRPKKGRGEKGEGAGVLKDKGREGVDDASLLRN